MEFTESAPDPVKKFTGFFIVVAIHALLIYAVLTGLGKQLISVIKELPIEAQLIEEVTPPPPPAPVDIPPSPVLAEPPPPFIPVPEVQVDLPVSPNAILAISTVQPADLTEVATNPNTAPAVVKAQVDFNTCDKPAYPSMSLRNEEKGVVRIQFLIGVDGRVADSRVEKSSGYKGLDNAAKNALSVCRFKPGTVDGKPQQLWTAVDYVWRLPN